MKRKIRVGFLGLGPRFEAWLHNFRISDEAEAVAGADLSPTALTKAKEAAPGLSYYDSLDRLLEHELDAVFITTPAYVHAPDAVRCLRAGRAVLSEVAACWTMAEAVALYEAATASGAVYMLAENYCYLLALQEMHRLYRSGAIGELLFADVQYIAKYGVWWEPLCKRLWAWHNWMPQSYYTTHAIGPLLRITGLRPVSVTAQMVSNNAESLAIGKLSDEVAAFTLRLSNGAMANVVSSFIAPRATHLWWHLLGTRGSLENHRFWDIDRGKTVTHVDAAGTVNVFQATPEGHRKEIDAAGHGGADFYLLRDFARAVRGEAPPTIDIGLALDATTPGILAHRSALAGGQTIEVPDFSKAAAREHYRNDHASPFPVKGNADWLPPSVLGVSHLRKAKHSDATEEELVKVEGMVAQMRRCQDRLTE